MAALRAAICNALSGWWEHNVGIQVLWDLMTVARQPGETAASALKLSHIGMLWNMSQSVCVTWTQLTMDYYFFHIFSIYVI